MSSLGDEGEQRIADVRGTSFSPVWRNILPQIRDKGNCCQDTAENKWQSTDGTITKKCKLHLLLYLCLSISLSFETSHTHTHTQDLIHIHTDTDSYTHRQCWSPSLGGYKVWCCGVVWSHSGFFQQNQSESDDVLVVFIFDHNTNTHHLSFEGPSLSRCWQPCMSLSMLHLVFFPQVQHAIVLKKREWLAQQDAGVPITLTGRCSPEPSPHLSPAADVPRPLHIPPPPDLGQGAVRPNLLPPPPPPATGGESALSRGWMGALAGSTAEHWPPTGWPGTPSPLCCTWPPFRTASGWCGEPGGRRLVPAGTERPPAHCISLQDKR